MDLYHPTSQLLVSKIAAAATTSVANRHQTADMVVMHPRRWLWALSEGTANVANISTELLPGAPAAAVGQCAGLHVITSPSIPTDLGTGTDEDIVVVFQSDAAYVASSPYGFRVNRQAVAANAASLQVEFEVSRHLAAEFGRHASAVVSIGGSAFAATAE